MKQIKHFLLTVAMLLCSTFIFAQDFKVDGICYDITSETDNTVRVTYNDYYKIKINGSYVTFYNYYTEYSGTVTIPESVTYNGTTYSVTSIGSSAFQYCDGLTSVTIPNSVTSIGNYAFDNCSGLTSIEIPYSVTSIGCYAFANCYDLTSIIVDGDNPKYDSRDNCNAIIESSSNKLVSGCQSTIIPYSVTSIGEYAFRGCSGLTSVTIPNSVTSIGSYAFYDCDGLTSVTIPNNVTSIGSYALYDCDGLTSVEIPNSVTSIGGSAFENCSGLKSVTIPNSVTSIGDKVFYGCYNLFTVSIDCKNVGSWFSGMTSIIKVSLGDNVTSIGGSAFENCSGLTLVTIGNSVTSIGEGAFNDCSGLTSIEIPNSVTSIGSGAFRYCYNLRTVVNNSNLDIVKGSSNYGYVGYYAYRILSGENINGYYFDENNGEYTLIGYWGDETNLVLPENYKGNTYCINNSAFRGCSGLTSIEIPNSVISIDGYAFADCSGLTSIEIPNSVTGIGNYAFEGCSLKSLTIGSGVLSIGSDQCKPVKTIWLTNTPPSGYKNLQGNINYVANDQYSGLNNVWVYPYLSSAFETDGVKYVPVSPAERTCDAIDCSYDRGVVDINIGETVSFKGVEMKVQNVMPYTVYKQTSVKTLSVSHAGDIGNYAFYGCRGITDATISNEGNIGESAFEGAMTSDNAVLKVSNKGDIYPKAFYGCTGITDATISNKGDIGNYAFYGCTGITDATISNEGNIGEWAFYGCTALETLTFGENVISIGGSAFRGCSKLLAVTIPNKTTSLGTYSFDGCTLLKQLDLGNGVQSIGEYSFNGCSALPSIDIPASVTSVGDYTFKGCTSIADVVIKDRTTDLSLGSNGSSPLFADCPLDYVYIGGNISYQTSSSYGYSPFYRNTSLRSVVITDKEEEISDNEFYGCTNLKNVSIGSNVKKIGNWAFSGCSNLDYFSFGKSVESIGEEAFSDCVNMTQLISHAVTPPTCGTQALDDINKWNCTLKIPEGTNSAYMASNQWKEFFFMENIPAAINGVVMDGEDADKDAPVYNMHGVRMQNTDNLPAGIYIKNGKKYLVR